jgi:hypothetical protein
MSNHFNVGEYMFGVPGNTRYDFPWRNRNFGCISYVTQHQHPVEIIERPTQVSWSVSGPYGKVDGNNQLGAYNESLTYGGTDPYTDIDYRNTYVGNIRYTPFPKAYAYI